MQEILSSNPLAVTECCDPNNSRAQKPLQFETWLENEVSQHLTSQLRYSSGLTEPKCPKTKH